MLLIDSLYRPINKSDWDKVEARNTVIKTDAGEAVTDFITKTTTPQEFDEFCQRRPDYEPEQGGCFDPEYYPEVGTALKKAVRWENTKLAQHIISKQVVELGKTHLLNMDSPMILLFAGYGNRKRGFKVAKLLIRAGAHVNLAVKSDFDGDFVTVLQSAARLQNISSINMLIVNGALTYQPFTNEEHQNVKCALCLLFKRVKPLFQAMDDEKSCLRIFPNELLCKITLHQIWLTAHSYLED